MWKSRRADAGRHGGTCRLRVVLLLAAGLSPACSGRAGLVANHGRDGSAPIQREDAAAAGGDGGATASYAPWPCFGHDPQNTKRSTADTSANTGTRKWSFFTGGRIGAATPVIGADGTIYIGSLDGKLYAVRPPESGSVGVLAWTYATGRAIDSAATIAPDGTIYVASMDGYLYALTAPATGTQGVLKWRAPVGGQSSPAIGPDGTVYVGDTAYERFYAISADGLVEWSCDNRIVWQPGPVIGVDGTVYVVFHNMLSAVSPSSTGNNCVINWSIYSGQLSVSPPAIGADGTLYFGNDWGTFYAAAPSPSRTEPVDKWTYSGVGDASPAIGSDGTIYAVGGRLFALASPTEGQTGVLKWSFEHASGLGGLSPALGADGTVFVATPRGDLFAVTAPASGTTGVLKWVTHVEDKIEAAPSIGGDGTVYVAAVDGQLSAFQ